MTHPIPEAALDADIAILGKKGGGKTYTAKGVVERLLDMGRRVLILDPLGVWAGLRTGADGESPGYPVAIFGGEHGDMPLDTAAASAIADVLARENVPAVLDLSELSKSAQQSFLLAFLHELRRVNREPLTIVLEEADVFVPQNPLGDDSKALHGEIDWIARRGRFRGFRLITITQRPARLSKDVLTQCATLVAHRLPAPQDREAVKAWVDGNGDRDLAREVFDTLATLKVGEAWVWASEVGALTRETFPTIRTLDTSATPKAGERRVEPKTLAQVDLSAIRAALAAEKPKPQERRRTAGDASPQVVRETDPAEIAAAEQRGYRLGFEEGVPAAASHVRGYTLIAGVGTTCGERMIETAERDNVGKLFSDDIIALLDRGSLLPTTTPFPPSNEAAKIIAPTPFNAPARHAAPKPKKPAADRATNAAGEKLLAALVRYNGVRWTECCIAAGVLHGNGYFYGGKKWLVDNAYAEEASGVAVATDLGVSRAGECGPPMSLAEIVATWAPKLRRPAPAMLAYVAQHRRRPVTADELAQAIGAKPGNGYWYGGLKPLLAIGLIEQNRDIFQLSDFLARAP